MKRIFALAMVLILGSNALAATIYVDGSGSHCSGSPCGGNGSMSLPYCCLQTALNAASSGDTILVAAGTYSLSTSDRLDSFVVPQGVHLIGAGSATILSGLSGNNTNVMRFDLDGSDDITIIEDVRITGGNADSGVATPQECISCLNCEPDDMDMDCVSGGTQNEARVQHGGGVWVVGIHAALTSGSPEIIRFVDCHFDDNYAQVSGGAIHAQILMAQ